MTDGRYRPGRILATSPAKNWANEEETITAAGGEAAFGAIICRTDADHVAAVRDVDAIYAGNEPYPRAFSSSPAVKGLSSLGLRNRGGSGGETCGARCSHSRASGAAATRS